MTRRKHQKRIAQNDSKRQKEESIADQKSDGLLSPEMRDAQHCHSENEQMQPAAFFTDDEVMLLKRNRLFYLPSDER